MKVRKKKKESRGRGNRCKETSKLARELDVEFLGFGTELGQDAKNEFEENCKSYDRIRDRTGDLKRVKLT